MMYINELGFGFLESVYEEAMMIALESVGLRTEQQVPIPVWFRGQNLGIFEADLIVNRAVIVEIKAVSQLVEAHSAQLLHYLRAYYRRGGGTCHELRSPTRIQKARF